MAKIFRDAGGVQGLSLALEVFSEAFEQRLFEVNCGADTQDASSTQQAGCPPQPAWRLSAGLAF